MYFNLETPTMATKKRDPFSISKKPKKIKVKPKKIQIAKIPLNVPNVTPSWTNKRGFLIPIEKRIAAPTQRNININIEAFIKFNEELDKFEEELGQGGE